jgi:hypothetical protein
MSMEAALLVVLVQRDLDHRYRDTVLQQEVESRLRAPVEGSCDKDDLRVAVHHLGHGRLGELLPVVEERLGSAVIHACELVEART